MSRKNRFQFPLLSVLNFILQFSSLIKLGILDWLSWMYGLPRCLALLVLLMTGKQNKGCTIFKYIRIFQKIHSGIMLEKTLHFDSNNLLANRSIPTVQSCNPIFGHSSGISANFTLVLMSLLESPFAVWISKPSCCARRCLYALSTISLKDNCVYTLEPKMRLWNYVKIINFWWLYLYILWAPLLNIIICGYSKETEFCQNRIAWTVWQIIK